MKGNVLVTGGCGFIGCYVTDELLAAGHRVRILDSLVEQVHGSVGTGRRDDAEIVAGDIRDQDLVRSCLKGIDHVVHLAAEVGVGQSMYEIDRYVGANDLGTAVLLQELIEHPVESLVVASSMSVYGEGLYETADGTRCEHVRRRRKDIEARHWDLYDDTGAKLRPTPTDEEKPVDLASIYALTKYTQERAVLIFAEAYGIRATALRLFNVFGSGQALSNPYTGVLANFASRLANGQHPTIFEDGEQRRDFVHVRDVAHAFVTALDQPLAAGQVINIGSGVSYSIREIAQLLAQAMGVPQIEPEILLKARAGDIRNCFADISRARELMGFQPRYRLENSLQEFADWVRGTPAIDNGAEMRRELEARGLVS